VARDRHLRRSRLAVLLVEIAADQRLNAEHREEAPRHHARAQQFGRVAIGEADRAIGIRGVTFEASLLFAEREVVHRREPKLEWR
jgi:hypothetical protein